MSTAENIGKIMESMPQNYRERIGDVVFGKSGKFPFWPSMIWDPRFCSEAVQKMALKKLKTGYLVYFYGSKDFGFSNFKNTKNLEENIEAMKIQKMMKSEAKKFDNALKFAIEDSKLSKDERIKFIHGYLKVNSDQSNSSNGSPKGNVANDELLDDEIANKPSSIEESESEASLSESSSEHENKKTAKIKKSSKGKKDILKNSGKETQPPKVKKLKAEKNVTEKSKKVDKASELDSKVQTKLQKTTVLASNLFSKFYPNEIDENADQILKMINWLEFKLDPTSDFVKKLFEMTDIVKSLENLGTVENSNVKARAKELLKIWNEPNSDEFDSGSESSAYQPKDEIESNEMKNLPAKRKNAAKSVVTAKPKKRAVSKTKEKKKSEQEKFEEKRKALLQKYLKKMDEDEKEKEEKRKEKEAKEREKAEREIMIKREQEEKEKQALEEIRAAKILDLANGFDLREFGRIEWTRAIVRKNMAVALAGPISNPPPGRFVERKNLIREVNQIETYMNMKYEEEIIDDFMEAERRRRKRARIAMFSINEEVEGEKARAKKKALFDRTIKPIHFSQILEEKY